MLNVDLDPAVDADNDGDVADDFTALSIGVDGNVPADATLMLVMSDVFAAGTAATLMFARAQADGDAAAGNQPVAAFETEGTYNGTMGTYRCNADDGGAPTARSRSTRTAI